MLTFYKENVIKLLNLPSPLALFLYLSFALFVLSLRGGGRGEQERLALEKKKRLRTLVRQLGPVRAATSTAFPTLPRRVLVRGGDHHRPRRRPSTNDGRTVTGYPSASAALSAASSGTDRRLFRKR